MVNEIHNNSITIVVEDYGKAVSKNTAMTPKLLFVINSGSGSNSSSNTRHSTSSYVFNGT